jgi:multiple sugar transport system substrate-binding protein
MDRRTILKGIAAASAVPLLPVNMARAAELTKKYSGTQLKVMLGAGGGAFDVYKKMTEAFTAQTGITFDYTTLPDADYYSKIVLDIATNTNAFDAYLYTYFWKGELEPGFADLEALVPTIEGAPDLGLDDYPGQVVEVYGRSNGKLIGLPVLGDATMLVWNTAQYKEAGLDPAAAPSTWEEVVANGLKLKAAGKNGFGLPAGKGYQVACLWMILFAKFGGEYFGPNFAPQFNSEPALKATKFMVDQLQPLAPSGNLTWDFSEMLDGLATGVSGQGMMWPGGFGRMLDPTQSAEAKNLAYRATPDASLLGGWAVGVNDRSQNREAAALWAAYLASAEAQKQGPAPARISVLSDPELVKAHGQYPAVLQALGGKLAQFPNVPQSGQVVAYLYDELNAAISGDKSAEDAMNDLQNLVEDFIVALNVRQ